MIILDGIVVNEFIETDHIVHLDHSEELKSLLSKHLKENVCIYAYGTEILASKCDQSYPCGVCRIQKKQKYYLKGLKSSVTGNDGIYDSQFYLDGYKNGKPKFR